MIDSLVLTKLVVQGASGVVIEGGCLLTCVSTPAFLTIPRGVVKLCQGCLSGQDTLKRVTIGGSVVSVDTYCFANCPNLEVIRCGTQLRPFEDRLKQGNNARVEYVGGE